MDRPQRIARKAERTTAERHGGRVTPASGSGSTVKNDVRNDDWSFEVKSTSNLSYSLKADSLIVAENNALSDGRRMAFIVEFARTFPIPTKRYVIISEDDFREITGS